MVPRTSAADEPCVPVAGGRGRVLDGPVQQDEQPCLIVGGHDSELDPYEMGAAAANWVARQRASDRHDGVTAGKFH